jgi:hypothetical protein
LQIALQLLSVDHFNHFELDEVIANGLACMKGRNRDDYCIKSETTTGDKQHIPIVYLIGGSELFRSAILNLQTNAAFCSLLTTKLGNIASHSQLKILCERAVEFQSTRVGTVVYKTSDENINWFVLVAGKLKVKITPTMCESGSLQLLDDEAAQQSEMTHEINEGEMFGGLISQAILEQFVVTIEVVSPSTLFALRPEDFNDLQDEDPEIAGKIMASIEGTL